jgi:HK97 family phage major capsid protein
MTEEEKAAHDALIAEINKNIESANKSKVDVSELEAIKTKLENSVSKEDFEAVKAEAIRLATEFKAIQEKGTTEKKLSLKDALKEHAEIIKLIANRVTEKEVVVKALLQRSAIDGNENAYDLPEIGALSTRKLSLYDLFPKLNIGKGNKNGTVRYYDWDEATIVRAAAAVAEGAAFPESTAKFKKYAVTIQKVGDTLPVTEEFFEDESLFAAELEMFLKVNVELEVDRQLYEGDGTGNTIVGLMSSINSYDLPATGSIQAPNIYDLIEKVDEQITTLGGSKFTPDVVIANKATINRMKLAKDANDNYILPPFVSRDGRDVGGKVVIESNIFGDNELVVGDRRFARIYEIDGITMSKGTVNTQFSEDEMTLKVRKRLAFLIRNCDKKGFRKVLDIDAALAALTIV